MEDALSQIITELESQHNLQNSNSENPISESALLGLQTLFDDNESDRLWEELSSKNLPPSILVRPISSAMDAAHPRISISASHLYLTILTSPKSPIYTIFTPVAFLSLLRSLRRSFKNHRTVPPGTSDVGPRSKTKRSRKGGGSRRNACRAHDEEAEDDPNRGAHLDIRLVFSVLEKLESVLDLIHLNRFPDTLKSLVETVAGIPIMALESYDNSANFNGLCDLCFRILHGVLRPEHGDQTVAAVEVLKSLSPSILLLKSQVKTFALRFVTGRMMAAAKDCEAVRKAVVYLPRYLVNKAPEKSESRASAVDSIIEVVRAMELDDQIGFADYVVELTHGKAQLRLIAVDLIFTMLTTLRNPLGVNLTDGVADEGGSWWGIRCLEALIECCSDVVAGIRARALTNVAQAIGFLVGNPGNCARLQEVMGFGNAGVHRGSAGGLNELLRKRCVDEKAAVRKAALLLIIKSTDLNGSCIDEVMLKTIAIACSDPLVSIRKAGVLALSEVFRKFSESSVITEWLHAIPRLITDNETSIQTECENLFQELILDRVSRFGSASSSSNTTSHASTSLKWSLEGELESIFSQGVLVLLKGICDGEVAPCVRKICTSLGKKKQLRPAIATALQNIINTSESIWLNHSMPIEKWTAPPGAWLLLSEVSSFLLKAVKWEFLHHHWQLLDNSKSKGEVFSPVRKEEMASLSDVDSSSIAWAGDRVFLLQTISNVSVELPSEPAAELAHDLLQRIEEFNMHSAEVNAHVKALRTICKQKATNSEEGDSLVLKWVHQLISKAICILNNYMLEVSEASKDDTFLTPPRSGNRKGKREAIASESLSRAVTAVFTVGSLVVVSPSADLKGIVPLLHTIITSGSSKAKPKELAGLTVSIKQVALTLYIQSWMTMGKICLADGKLAKRYIPLFVQELEKSDSAALRNNIVVVMADFCVRYTALVDCYIPKITSSLRDPCEVVRRQTFILLSRLLQRDYVKWRGVLFLRFLLSLVDESEKIRHQADFLFGSILKAKAPLLAYNSFVEAIFILNDCNMHSGLSESHGSHGRRLFSIRGNDERSRSKRMHIYVSLLKQMAPEHLLATSAKLCAEILAAASDGALNLDDVTGQSVLQDAFQILACKEMRIQPHRAAAAAEIDEEGGDCGGAVSSARGRVVTQVAKKNLIQNAIPIFIELKRLLESKNSPLTGCLMECLRALLKEYKNEMDDILVADKQLQKELIYDMHKYETAKTRSTVADAVASIQRSAAPRSPTSRTAGATSGAPRASTGNRVHEKLAGKLGAGDEIASAVADVAAAATVRSVLKDMNKGTSTPPLHSMSMPKLKTTSGGDAARGNLPPDVLESLRRRQSFDLDNEN
ncbi:uncharacterized protein LOC131231370 [Magnolia sinica]|uniref:uncharacterized protein LOC131231370 n=1 Tax=Magnolia sinica TaxID=86752 RepID=UPI00265A4DB8|nr:uncharacterized protein LOC131231370 [Magnolia sinica]